MVDDLIFHDVAAALALPSHFDGDNSSNSNTNKTGEGADDAFVDSLLRLEDDAPATADDLEVALLAGEMMLDASHVDEHANIMALYGSGEFRHDLVGVDDDASTDVASESSSPPPAMFNDKTAVASPAPASPSQTSSPCQPYSPPRTIAARLPLLPTQSSNKRLAPAQPTGNHRARSPSSIASPVQKTEPLAPSPLATMAFPPNALPYALPIAYFAPATLNANQKRPLADVLPSGLSNAQAGGKSVAGIVVDPADDHSAKKSKREIRQMKNRESANKSRLRRKAQLGELTTEVAELKKKEQELQMVIAGLRAENKSLQNQNSFLQSLVTTFKRDGHPADAMSSSQLAQQKHVAVYDHHPSIPSHTNFIALPVLDAQEHSCQDEDDEFEVLDKRSTKRKRSLASITTASAATLTMCASVFGITLLADYDGGYATTGNIRQSGRVLHEVSPQTSSAVGAEGCSPDHGPLSFAMVWAKLLAAWEFVTTSDLAYGVLLNVLSFVVIMMVYHWWQQSSSTTSKGKSRRSHRYGQCGHQGHLRHRICGHNAVDGMKQRSASWHTASLHDEDASDEECPSALR